MAVQRLIRETLLACGLVVTVSAVGCTTTAPPPPTPTVPTPTASTETAKVPNLVTKSRAVAIQAVLKLRLNVRVVPLGEPAGKPKDHVARQVPLPGSTVAIGAEVLLVVYCKPAPCKSPPKGRTIYDPCTCATRS